MATKAKKMKKTKKKVEARSIRYTDEEKREIVKSVLRFDKKHGRGGKAEAVRDYGVSYVSLWKWMKDSRYVKSTKKKAA